MDRCDVGGGRGYHTHFNRRHWVINLYFSRQARRRVNPDRPGHALPFRCCKFFSCEWLFSCFLGCLFRGCVRCFLGGFLRRHLVPCLLCLAFFADDFDAHNFSVVSFFVFPNAVQEEVDCARFRGEFSGEEDVGFFAVLALHYFYAVRHHSVDGGAALRNRMMR